MTYTWEAACDRAEKILEEAGVLAGRCYQEAREVGIDCQDSTAMTAFVAERLIEADHD